MNPHYYFEPVDRKKHATTFKEDMIGLLILIGVVIFTGSVMFAAGVIYASKYLCTYAG
jgi:hypothetical protein